MNEAPAEPAADPGTHSGDAATGEFARAFGVSPAVAQRLADAGHSSVASVRALGREGLAELGLEESDVERILAAPEGNTVKSAR